MKLFPNIPFDRVNWITSIFLTTTAVASVTAVPWYIYNYGLDPFFIVMFFLFYIATGMSITLGYHRLFSHTAFKAKWPVKLFTLIFGAAAFENSALDWSEDHRIHHKYVDKHNDPYDISKGFFWAHIGWLFFKINVPGPRKGVKDLENDKLVVLQHNYCQRIAVLVGLVLPTLIGYWYTGTAIGALGGFLIIGVARIVAVQHSTFFINSLCHMVGNRPYSIDNSARDSWIMALFTFGEGYHNYHHQFANDYRNGVKPWQFDPTKWMIWILSKFGLASNLKEISKESILKAEMDVAKQRIEENIDLIDKLLQQAATSKSVQVSCEYLKEALDSINDKSQQLQDAVRAKTEVSLQSYNEWRQELRLVFDHLQCLSAA